MKINNIKVYKIDIPLKEGSYKWAHNNKVEEFETLEDMKTYIGECLDSNCDLLQKIIFSDSPESVEGL